jgi:hypothetical protein
MTAEDYLFSYTNGGKLIIKINQSHLLLENLYFLKLNSSQRESKMKIVQIVLTKLEIK